MDQSCSIDAHDAVFASRMTPTEWAWIRAFRDRPTFFDGFRQHEGVARHLFTNNLILNKVVLEAWRFQILALTLYLYEARDASDPRSGLTFTNLAAVCADLGLASSGRVFAFLNLMKLGGYLVSERSPLDNRVVQMKPTAVFMATVDQWTNGIFAAIDAAAPEDNLVARSVSEPDLGTRMRTRAARGLIDGWRPLDPFPEVEHFASVDGGWMLIEQVAAVAQCRPDGLVIVPASINLRTFGRDVGGSRSNLRRLLESAYDRGLLAEPPHGGAHIVLSSQMLCAFITFIAAYLGNYQRHVPPVIPRG